MAKKIRYGRNFRCSLYQWIAVFKINKTMHNDIDWNVFSIVFKYLTWMHNMGMHETSDIIFNITRTYGILR